jgi:hypothetical protein
VASFRRFRKCFNQLHIGRRVFLICDHPRNLRQNVSSSPCLPGEILVYSLIVQGEADLRAEPEATGLNQDGRREEA